MKRLLALAFLLGTAPTGAQVDPVVRLAVKPETVRVGEALTLRVTVLVPTWFPRPPVYPDFEVANAITRLPPDSSFPTSERVGGENWSGIVREYRIYPLAAASYRIEGASMRVTYANPGDGPVVRDVVLPPVVFRGTVPGGAEGLEPYLAGRELTLSVALEGNDGELAVGDAVVLTYSAALDGLPSMFLPPLAPAFDAPVEAGRVSVHADAPRFEDDERLATRSERVTLLLQAGGELTVPAVALDYWNIEAGEVRSARVEALQLSVSGPAAGQVDGAAAGASRWRLPLLAGALLFLALFAIRAVMLRLRRRGIAAQVSEPHAFRALRRALRDGSGARQYRALQHWLTRLEPGLCPRAFARAYGDATLCAAVDALSAHCFDGSGEPLAPDRLAKALVQARQRYRRSARRRRRNDVLAPLNP
ncbi:MAG: hypothetical protein ACX93N_03975 [Pseudohaliea sp.]